MLVDEFDDLAEPARAQAAALAQPPVPRPAPVPRLVSRLYAAAPPALRERLLHCLLEPLGTLGTMGVAAGAFGCYLYQSGSEGSKAAMTEVARYSNAQMAELARFVAQVQPQALHEFTRLIGQQPVGMAAFTASAALLLVRLLRQPEAGTAPTPTARPRSD
ncbi:conserved hypothetical protein [Rubrivivax sp. A210]|uniref:hypothetical protein n=1 Tax=Rubrivivax sp. A210 TaxID=2772301 RepID=UPI001919A0E1|nr:hypothetical protein [Rubrivivax sp. A210]CAD5371691.1 conserved hypothetical protein [Rubrivivax sp. A210]